MQDQRDLAYRNWVVESYGGGELCGNVYIGDHVCNHSMQVQEIICRHKYTHSFSMQ